MEPKHSSSFARLNAVAMGEAPADLVLTGCIIVNVYTKELCRSQIAISGDRIAYVGPDASHTIGPKTVKIDLGGRYVTPGFADPHTHIDQFVLPAELAEKSLLCGVTSLFSDPIDIVSVAGSYGFGEFLKMCQNTPIRIFNMVPGGLPVDPKFSHSSCLNPSQTSTAVKDPDVLGLGEIFFRNVVTARDPQIMKKISDMLDAGCIINGHTAGASDEKLNAYIASGILSCHEPINSDQVLDRLRLGMWVMIREGSIRRDIGEIIPGILSNKIHTNRLMFCSDGVDPNDIQQYGHIDHCIRESVKLGLDPIDAVTMASRNCFDYYNMGRDLGGIAPGRLADIVVFDDLKQFKPCKVFVGGRLVVSDGIMVVKTEPQQVPDGLKNTVRLENLTEGDFAVKSDKSTVTANIIRMLTAIITRLDTDELPVRDGNVMACPDRDIYKVAAFDRTGKTDERSVGFLSNFGADIGAFASTWSFHENDLIVIGSDEKDMAIAANNLIKTGGGMTVVNNTRTLACMPLQIAGILSSDPFDTVSENLTRVNNAIVDSGCKFKKPHLIPLFLPFLALPSVRILCSGIVDVKKRSFIPCVD